MSCKAKLLSHPEATMSIAEDIGLLALRKDSTTINSKIQELHRKKLQAKVNNIQMA